MENIIQPNDTFQFSNISLAHPSGIQGGAYFTKIFNNGKPLYIQTPKSLTKQGFVKNGKKIYVDLMFDNNNEQFIHWLENLEAKCQDLIFDKKNSWFDNQLDKSDIETAFTSPIRIFRSGKFYLVRVNAKVSSSTNLPTVKIYNESETILTMDDVKLETNIISILEIQGIKFTSRNFQIEIELKQVMLLNDEPIFESCLIKTDIQKKFGTTALSRDDFNTDTEKVIPNHPNTTTQSISLNTDTNSGNNAHQNNITSEIIDNATNEDYDSEDVDDEEHPPLTLGSEIRPQNVRFKECDVNGLEEIDIDLEENTLQNKEDSDELREVDLFTSFDSLAKESNSITLKKPNQVYYEIYKQALKKAKQTKKEAVLAFLEAKNIKKTYMLEDLSDDDSDDESINLDILEDL